MTDSKKRQQRSDFDQLVHDIVHDFKHDTRDYSNYLQRRRDLATDNTDAGLAEVNSRILEAFEEIDPKKYKIAPDLHRRLKGWARVLVNRTTSA